MHTHDHDVCAVTTTMHVAVTTACATYAPRACTAPPTITITITLALALALALPLTPG